MLYTTFGFLHFPLSLSWVKHTRHPVSSHFSSPIGSFFTKMSSILSPFLSMIFTVCRLFLESSSSAAFSCAASSPPLVLGTNRIAAGVFVVMFLFLFSFVVLFVFFGLCWFCYFFCLSGCFGLV